MVKKRYSLREAVSKVISERDERVKIPVNFYMRDLNRTGIR